MLCGAIEALHILLYYCIIFHVYFPRKGNYLTKMSLGLKLCLVWERERADAEEFSHFAIRYCMYISEQLVVFLFLLPSFFSARPRSGTLF